MEAAKSIEELKIPTSYGFISAKAWGKDEPQNLKILAVHGFRDNASSFDRLFELLKKDSLYIVSIDLPGHGLSAHLPHGVPYTNETWIIAIKNVLSYLKWTTNVTVIAHSMGALASLEFASLFPYSIERLVLIDTIKHRVFEPNKLPIESAKCIDSFGRFCELPKATEHRFTYEQGINFIFRKRRASKLTRRSAMCLIKRSAYCTSSRYMGSIYFRDDPSLDHMIQHKYDKQHLLTLLSSLKCQMFILRANNTPKSFKCKYDDEFLELYKKKCKKFKLLAVDGDHYVHLTSPQNISDHINQYLAEALQDESSKKGLRGLYYKGNSKLQDDNS